MVYFTLAHTFKFILRYGMYFDSHILRKYFIIFLVMGPLLGTGDPVVNSHTFGVFPHNNSLKWSMYTLK